jgi:hypothetical protein
MLFEIGKRYLFMTQRYGYVGTVMHVTPTHVRLGNDARVLYEDFGPFEDWAANGAMKAAKEGRVPGQILSTLGTDATPCPSDLTK